MAKPVRQRGGKRRLVDEWEFYVDDVLREVKVYLVNGKEGGFAFEAVSDAKSGMQTLTLRDADINNLRTRLQTELDQTTNIPWKKFIAVLTNSKDGGREGFSTSYNATADEIYEKTGQAEVKIDFEFRVLELAQRGDKTIARTKDGNVSSAESILSSFGGQKLSMLPYTPEREAALVRLREGFLALGTRLQELMVQENVDKTLEMMSKGELKLLPAASTT